MFVIVDFIVDYDIDYDHDGMCRLLLGLRYGQIQIGLTKLYSLGSSRAF